MHVKGLAVFKVGIILLALIGLALLFYFAAKSPSKKEIKKGQSMAECLTAIEEIPLHDKPEKISAETWIGRGPTPLRGGGRC